MNMDRLWNTIAAVVLLTPQFKAISYCRQRKFSQLVNQNKTRLQKLQNRKRLLNRVNKAPETERQIYSPFLYKQMTSIKSYLSRAEGASLPYSLRGNFCGRVLFWFTGREKVLCLQSLIALNWGVNESNCCYCHKLFVHFPGSSCLLCRNSCLCCSPEREIRWTNRSNLIWVAKVNFTKQKIPHF